MEEPRSMVRWYPNKEKNKCGYCSKPTGSVMFGMWAYRLRVSDYQDLIDRGWRRSGHYCYKPVMHETCCPLYTIRCHALEFRPTKSQKKVMKKMSKFLKTGELKEREKREFNDTEGGCEERVAVKEAPDNIDMKKIDGQHLKKSNVAGDKHKQEEREDEELLGSPSQNDKEDAGRPYNKQASKQRAIKKGQGPDPTRPPCKKAKMLRQEKKLKKIETSGQNLDVEAPKSECKTVEEFLNDISKDDKHKLTLKLIDCTDESGDWRKNERVEFELYKKYQMVIHNDPPSKNTLQSFLRFLVKSPLERKERPEHRGNPKVPGYGSYHQQYWLDDKLIAVGVIDILPKCVSAVYFFYDPDYRELTLGTYGALKEVQLARELYPALDTSYYYMGYYAHSCVKMRYKGNFHPSDLLCPETYQWFPIDKCLQQLNKTKYCRFNLNPKDGDSNECTEDDLDCLKIVCKEQYTTYRLFKKYLKGDQEFENFGKFLGGKLVKSLIAIES